MKTASLIAEIKEEAARIAKWTPDATWYLYGSVLDSGIYPADIDVLIVYTSAEDALVIRRELRDLCHSLPLHLLLVTRDEEAELNFIATQGCMQVFPELQ